MVEASGQSRRRLAAVLALVVAYMLAEVVGGILSGSLALLADAAHMLSDAGALALSLFAAWVARRPPTAERTFGYHRTEILAALANGAALGAISIFLFVEAFQRLLEPRQVAAPLMMTVAAGGLAVNAASLWILRGERRGSLNVRGAWLHVLSDALGSVQALAAGAAIWAFGWAWADPAASVLIGLLVIHSAWALLREAVEVLMEGAPSHIDVGAVREAIAEQPGVVGVHDLHVWTITSGLECLSAHVVTPEPPSRGLLRAIRRTLEGRFGIDHITIQLEPEEFPEEEPPV